MDNKDLDKNLMDKLEEESLEIEKEMREKDFEDTNPYRHIEEANEENYKAVDNK